MLMSLRLASLFQLVRIVLGPDRVHKSDQVAVFTGHCRDRGSIIAIVKVVLQSTKGRGINCRWLGTQEIGFVTQNV